MILKATEITKAAMRTISLTFFALATLVSIAQAKDITTVSGRSYQQCQVIKVTPDGVTFRHSHGIAKVLFADMTETAQQAFGYDEGKEKAFQDQQLKERAEKKEIAKQKAEAAAKAYAEARQAHLENQTLLAMQRAANAQVLAVQQQQEINGLVIGAVGVGPGYGYSIDGRDYARHARRGSHGIWSYPQTQNFSQSLFGHYGALVNYGQPLLNGCVTPRYPVVHPGHARPMHPVPCVRAVSTIPGRH